jgi:hypothetical protein
LAQSRLAEQQRAIILRKTREGKQKNCEGGRGLLHRNVSFADAFGHCATTGVEGCEHHLNGFIGFRKATF